jgi:hypothetical protein
MPLALTDDQMTLITVAAGLLAPQQRGTFLRSVAGRLDAMGAGDVPTDSEIRAACFFVLETRGVGGRGLLAAEKGKRG